MKYDIAKNEDGPLSRTVKVVEPSEKAKEKHDSEGSEFRMDAKTGFGQSQDDLTSDQHPGLDERLSNIESHLAVRYGMFLFCWSSLYISSCNHDSSFSPMLPPRSTQVS